MKRCKVTVLAAALLAMVCAANAAPSSPFLSKSVPDTKSLVREVSSDRTVATRYAKHFGTTPAALLAYFKTNLKLGRLTRPHVTTMYSVGIDGNIERSVVTLAPGTRVFSTVWGDPILDWETGDPLSDKLPLPNDNEVVTKVLAAPPQEIAAAVPAVVAPAPAAAATTAIPAAITRGGGGLNPLAILGGLGTAAALLGGGGGGGSTSSVTPPSDDGNPPPPIYPPDNGDGGTVNPPPDDGNHGDPIVVPVPDPASFLVLSSGLGLLVARRRFRKA